MSVDPIISDPSNGQTINAYSYVINNPLKYTDPSGYAIDIVACGGVFKETGEADTRPCPGKPNDKDQLGNDGQNASWSNGFNDGQTGDVAGSDNGPSAGSTTTEDGVGFTAEENLEAMVNRVRFLDIFGSRFGEESKSGEVEGFFSTLRKVASVAASFVPYSEAIGMAMDGDLSGAFKSAAVETGAMALGMITAGAAYGTFKAYKKFKLLRQATEKGNVQNAGGASPWTNDLSVATGKAAKARNRAINAVVNEDLSNLKLTFKPKYSPFAAQGVAKQGIGTQIGKKAFTSRSKLVKTIVHEELHHRWWKRGVKGFHHSPNRYVPNEKFYRVLERYNRMRGY